VRGGDTRCSNAGFTPQEVANLMWALATMGVKDPDAGPLEAMQGRATATAGGAAGAESCTRISTSASLRFTGRFHPKN